MHSLVKALNEAMLLDEMRREAADEVWALIEEGQPNYRMTGNRKSFRGGTIKEKDWRMPFWFRQVRHERHNHALPE